MPTLEIHGHRLFVELHGPPEGEAVVLLHHGLGAVQSWKGQIPALVEAGYRVIAYDRWGHGRSSPRPRYGMPAFEADLADLEALLAALDAPRPALIGHSDGGKIAMYYAAARPERVAALVIVSTNVYIEAGMEAGILGVRRQFYQEPVFREKLRRVHGEKTEALFRGWFEGWTDPQQRAWDMRPQMAKIGCPALLVHGCEDEHASPQHAAAAAAAIPGAELWLVPGAGHMLPQDFPQAFNAGVLEFLRKAREAAPTAAGSR